MKTKLLIIAITTMMLVQSIVVTISEASPGPDYDLLIITPAEFQDELEPLKEFKDATGRPTKIVTLEDIYTVFAGADKAEEVKMCIAYYKEYHNIKYVLLVGDVDKLPMRYFYLKREVTDEVRWLQYYLTDHYYADLYDNGGVFCSWDANGNGIFGEIIDYDDDGDFDNIDGMDYEFEVSVGRIPVNTDDEVEIYVDKVISYETGVSFDDAWFKNILLVTGATAGWVYPSLPTTYDEDENDAIATTMSSLSFTAHKMYHSVAVGDSHYPDPININTHLNDGAGFMNVISHGNPESWGVYDVTTDMSGLTNDDNLTIIYSFGCSTAKLGPICPGDSYIDVTGVTRNYGGTYSYPISKTTWVEPAEPNPIQDSTTDIACMPEYWNFDSENGAVAFVGSTAETSGVMGSPVMQKFFQSFATDGYRVLGDVWNSVNDKILTGGYNIGSDWDRTRRYLYINVFGDPSLAIGGLDDKPPVTSLSIGSPKYIDGSTTSVKSSTPFTLSATDDFSIATTYYRYYPLASPPSIWTAGTSFTIGGSDGAYFIEYYSVDTGGNTDYPIKSKTVIVDTSPPITTLSIGSPKYISGVDTYVSSNTYIALGVDDPSGIKYTQYRIDGGSWTTYTTHFQLSGSDGPHTISYKSVDNLDNEETMKEDVLILDNTPPVTTLTIGDPKYSYSGNTYVTSDTELTLSATDSGSGVNDIYYKINLGSLTMYDGAFKLTGDNGSYQIQFFALDNIDNQETTKSQTLILDNEPPVTTLTIGDPKYTNLLGDIYVTSSTDLTLSAADSGSGVDYTKYRIDEGSWVTYLTAFQLTGSDATYTVEFYSVDKLGNTEITQSLELILDNTPPEVNIELPENGDYVYGTITIKISATDAGSGVNNVDYSLDDGATWLPATYNSGTGKWEGTWDTTTYTEGTHTIRARAEDNVGNIGYDTTPTTVNIVYLEYEIDFSDSNWNIIDEFNVVFTKQKLGDYKVSTNPGAMYEIITITNTGTLVTLPELILDVDIPIETDFLGIGQEAFKFLGAKSVHVYLNGVDVTPVGKWLPSLNNINVMQSLSPGDTIEIYLHYEYAFKGKKYAYADISTWPGEYYIFITDILSAYGPSWTDTLSAIPVVIT